jgi:hypothetical protein
MVANLAPCQELTQIPAQPNVPSPQQVISSVTMTTPRQLGARLEAFSQI